MITVAINVESIVLLIYPIKHLLLNSMRTNDVQTYGQFFLNVNFWYIRT